MIISRTPLRVSFAGGGTDLPAFYNREPGAVLSTAINKYIYITTNKKFDEDIRASYSVTEIVKKRSELKHELIREGMRLLNIDGGIEIISSSDIPSSGTGLGSSSSFTVGLLNSLYAYQGRYASPERLGRESCRIEIDILGKPIGKQDQYAAAYGGFSYIQFNPDGSVFVDPILCKIGTKLELENRLLMLYTGITRGANDILAEQSQKTTDDSKTFETLKLMKGLADKGRLALENNNLDDFGVLLDEGWELKKRVLAKTSSPVIDDWYARAKKAGALGGKILGAGGGGFLLLYAHEDRHEAIKAALPELRPTPIQFESQGSKIIFVEDPSH